MLLERMSNIAKKGINFENKRQRAEDAIEADDINYRYEKGWAMANNFSKKNVMNLTAH